MEKEHQDDVHEDVVSQEDSQEKEHQDDVHEDVVSQEDYQEKEHQDDVHEDVVSQEDYQEKEHQDDVHEDVVSQEDYQEKEHQDDVHEDVVSQENSQPTESNQQTFTATCPLPPDITTCCSYDHNILSNIKCEQILPENMQEDSADSQRGRGVDERVVTGLQSVKCEE